MKTYSRSNSLHLPASILGGVLLLGVLANSHADEIADANKLFKQAQYAPALGKVNDVLAKNPKDAQARFLKGLILTNQSKTDEAIKTFIALTADYPELPEPYNNLAVLYANQGEYDKARLSLEMAIRTHPSYATAHENLGDIYAKMASQAYDRALKLDHGNTVTQTKLAMIQGMVGETTSKPSKPNLSASTPVVATKDSEAVTQNTAPKPVTATTPADTPKSNKDQEVLNAVHNWAAAWSAKNVRKYLSYYAKNFKIPGATTRDQWEAEREARIRKPKSIHVALSNEIVKFSDADHVTVEFRQSYNASHFKTNSNKTFLMEKSNGKWLITEERVK